LGFLATALGADQSDFRDLHWRSDTSRPSCDHLARTLSSTLHRATIPSRPVTAQPIDGSDLLAPQQKMPRQEKDDPTTNSSAVRKLVRTSPSADRILTRIANGVAHRQTGGSSTARSHHGLHPRQRHPWPTLIWVIRPLMPVCDQYESTLRDPNSPLSSVFRQGDSPHSSRLNRGGSGSAVVSAVRAPRLCPELGAGRAGSLGAGVERARGFRLEFLGWAFGVAGGSHRHRPGPPMSWNPPWVRR
jgi:hypothetical protein